MNFFPGCAQLHLSIYLTAIFRANSISDKATQMFLKNWMTYELFQKPIAWFYSFHATVKYLTSHNNPLLHHIECAQNIL